MAHVAIASPRNQLTYLQVHCVVAVHLCRYCRVRVRQGVAATLLLVVRHCNYVVYRLEVRQAVLVRVDISHNLAVRQVTQRHNCEVELHKTELQNRQ